MTTPHFSHEDSAKFIRSCNINQLLSMFDLLPDILFWIKDTHSRLIHANQCYLEHVGIHTLEQALGQTDADFAPRHIAKQFLNDDQRVIKGETVTERLEMNVLESGEVCWFTTSKRPLFDADGNIIGSYGTSRHLEKTSLALNSMDALKTPMSHIRQHYMQNLSMQELATLSHLSISALERRFKKYLGLTPRHYIIQVRLENARRLLVETTLPINVIAAEVGFQDASYFSRKFFQLFETKPSEFRQSYQ